MRPRAAAQSSGIVLVLGLVWGCGDELLPTPESPEVETWVVSELVRIGSPDDAEQGLTRVGAVRFGPKGRLYVSQPLDNVIRVYGRDGTLASVIGRSGQGPGEFSGLDGIGFRNDTLFASDSALGRVTFFMPGGELIRSIIWTTQQVSGRGGVLMATAPQVLLEDGSALVRPHSAVPIGPGGAPEGEFSIPVLRIGGGGEVIDTLAWERTEFRSATVQVEDTRIGLWSPFGGDQLFDLMPDGSGVVIADPTLGRSGQSPVFHVHRVDVSGDTAWSRAFSYTPVPMHQSAVERGIEELHEVVTRRPPPHPTEDQMEHALRREGLVPETFPPVSDLVGTQDGLIWVRREDLLADSVTWEVLDSNGGSVGSIQLPHRARVVAAQGGDVVTLERDELDVPFLVWYERD